MSKLQHEAGGLIVPPPARTGQRGAFAQGPLPKRLMALTLLLMLPLFFFGGPDWSSGPLYRSAWNLGHILFFGLLTLWINPRRWLAGWPLWLSVTTMVLLVGIGLELLQDGLDRHADWHDVFRNLIGCWLVLAWHPSIGDRSPPRQVSILHTTRFATTALVLLELWSVAQVAYQQYQIVRQLPNLYDFSEPHPESFWSGSMSRDIARNGSAEPTLKIQLGTEQYSGVWLHQLASDWRDYQRLELVLFNPSTSPFTMTLRINDVRHDRGDNAYDDRFNTRLFLRPGLNEFTIDLREVRDAPATRQMDMSNLHRLGLFTVYLPAPEIVYLTRIRLARDLQP
ncbi:succinyl-CoA synthetase subunit beta [Marinobacter sp. SS21]|uniref:succinyl-CoA synthetase subunit beta n=1 Tax=Marinobacter sp. SS21 TaxID=2979460 RepID=UPI00232ED2FD|nr:succinyl-CoA synthetase subunit beta [Marinobacter sp. SS21]MDC0661571.1 succinyl-CoA synthetase subunit beta [Marinobacter sp. SS21]